MIYNTGKRSHIFTVNIWFENNERASDCFDAKISNISAISWRKQVSFDDNDIHFVLGQQA